MKTVFCYAKPYQWKIVRAVTVKFGGSMVELLIPWILSKMVDDVIPLRSPALVCLFGGLMLAASLLACGLNITANRMAAAASRRITQDLRDDLFQRMTCLSSRQFQAVTLPSMISRVTSDSYHVHQFIGMMMRMGVRAPILTVGGVLMSVMLDPVLALAVLGLLPFMVLLLMSVYRIARPLFDRTQQLADEIVRVVRDDIAGIRVVKAFGKEAEENARFRAANDRAAGMDCKAGQVTAALNPGMNLLLNLGMVLVVILGAYRVNSGQTLPGKLIAMLSYMTLILNGMMFLSRFFRMYSKAAASAWRMEEILRTEPEPWKAEEPREDSENPEEEKVQGDLKCSEKEEGWQKAKEQKENSEGRKAKEQGRDRESRVQEEAVQGNGIVFEDVSFSYETGKKTADLEHISFVVPRGKMLGIIGPTGAGKSTVIRLLLGFYTPDGGKIMLDGTDIRQMDRRELRSRFGAALQNDHLFQASLEENIILGRQITSEQVENALQDAQAADFAAEKGVEAQLDIRGANLSGGQKQRIMLARALAADPDILILDDASSALDYATDARFRAALSLRRRESTVVMVAQRVSAVMEADQILVMEAGRAVGLGTHEELLDTCSLYREIYGIQMGENI